MRSETEVIIRAEIEHVFGRKIVSSRDCIHLSDEIFNKTKFKLNPNTLRRFFGLVKSKYPPSRATLNILCNYCGLRSIDEVETLKSRNQPEADNLPPESVVNYLVALFNELPVGNDTEGLFYHLVKHTIFFLNRNSLLIEKFQRLVVKTRYGKEFYFERFVQVDHLNGFYGDGLRYYLTEKFTPDAQVFAHSQLVFRYWLSGDDQKMESHFKEVAKHKPAASACPALLGYYYASLLFHTQVKGISQAAAIADIFHYHSLGLPAHPASYSFESIVTEALVLTGNYEEGLFYTDYQMKKYADDDRTEVYLLQHTYLLRAISLYKANDSGSAAKMVRKIRPSQFHFLAKKYQTILYAQIAGRLSRKMNEISEEQVGALIAETGFARLAAL